MIDWKYFSRPLIIRFSSNLQHTPTVQFDQLRFVQISPQSMSQLSEIINAHIPAGLTKSWSRIILWSGEMQMKRSRNKRSNSKTFVNDSIITIAPKDLFNYKWLKKFLRKFDGNTEWGKSLECYHALEQLLIRIISLLILKANKSCSSQKYFNCFLSTFRAGNKANSIM